MFRFSNKLLGCAEHVDNSLSSAPKVFWMLDNLLIMKSLQWVYVPYDLLCGAQHLYNLNLLFIFAFPCGGVGLYRISYEDQWHKEDVIQDKSIWGGTWKTYLIYRHLKNRQPRSQEKRWKLAWRMVDTQSSNLNVSHHALHTSQNGQLPNSKRKMKDVIS